MTQNVSHWRTMHNRLGDDWWQVSALNQGRCNWSTESVDWRLTHPQRTCAIQMEPLIDFHHEPPTGYRYEAAQERFYQGNQLFMSVFNYNDFNEVIVFRFYNTKKGEYYAPVNWPSRVT